MRWLALSAVVILAACASRDAIDENECELRVGISGDYAPFALADGDDIDGLDVDLARRLGVDLGCRVELVQFAWPDLLERLGRGDFELALGGITMRAERALRGIYSRPYARTGVTVLTRRDSALQSLTDLNRPEVRVAVNRGGHLERWARANLVRADLRPTSDNRSLPVLLAEARVDAIVTDSAEARDWADAGRLLGPYSTDYKAVLVAAPHAALAAQIDAWLAAREVDGWLASLRTRHLGDVQAENARSATRQSIAALVRLRLWLMPLVAAAKRASGSPVVDAAQERLVIERARSWSGDPGPRIDAVFAALIELAKLVQERSAPADAPPPLAVLRDAIARIDRQLVREIDRIEDAPLSDESPRDAWDAELAPVVQDLPLRVSDLDVLANALRGERGQVVAPGARAPSGQFFAALERRARAQSWQMP